MKVDSSKELSDFDKLYRYEVFFFGLRWYDCK